MNDIDRIEILMLEFILTEISRSYSLILYHHLSIYNDISISIGVFYATQNDMLIIISRLGL